MIPLTTLLSASWVKPVLVLMAACAVFLLGWGARGVTADRDIARLEARAEQVRAEQAVALADATKRVLTVERTITVTNDQEVQHARNRAAAAERRAADLDATRERLRIHLVRLASSDAYSEAASAADGGSPAAGPGLVLTELYRGADDEAAALARYADAAASAGLACERIYDGARAALMGAEP